MGKQMQFELWQECNSKCKFCYLGHNNSLVSSEEKIKNLEFAYNKISDLSNYPEYDTIALIGGEFFQGQMSEYSVKTKFLKLIDKINELKQNNYIKNVWIYATLTIGEQEDLYETLKHIENKQNFWILTSYDTLGRFHTPKMEENWKFHMKNIHHLYPEILFNTTTILSADFIEKYLNKTFSIQKFMNDYATTMFFKVPNRVKDRFVSNKEMNNMIGNFFPTRKLFLTFLKTIKLNEPKEIWNKLYNIDMRADTFFCKHDGIIKESIRDKQTYKELYDTNIDYIMDCGHLSVYNAYIDSDGCSLCDKHLIEQMI